jgi:hypothetical protein
MRGKDQIPDQFCNLLFPEPQEVSVHLIRDNLGLVESGFDGPSV